jgi:hypothetical protein
MDHHQHSSWKVLPMKISGAAKAVKEVRHELIF